MAEVNFDLFVALQDIELDRRQPVLLEMQAIRVGRDVFQQTEIEIRDQVARAIADLPVLHLEAGLVHLVGDAVRRHHLQSRRMKRAGAQIVRQRRLRFKQNDGEALLA